MSQPPDPHGPTYRLPAPLPPDPTGWHELRRKARATLWPPTDRAWAAVFAAAVAAAGLYGLVFQATLPGRLPSSTDWKAVAAILARDARPGDAVALAPPWAERAREVLPERIPSRPEAVLPILASPSYSEADEDLSGIRRVWLISLPGAPGGVGAIPGQLAARSAPVEATVPVGRLSLTRYDLRAPEIPLWSIGDLLASETREVGQLPRTCAVARFPGPDPKPALMRFPALPLGSALRGRIGLVGDVSGSRASASIRVNVDGVEMARLEATGAPAWRRFEIDTSHLPPARHEVAVELVPSGPLPRGVCVDLVALP